MRTPGQKEGGTKARGLVGSKKGSQQPDENGRNGRQTGKLKA